MSETLNEEMKRQSELHDISQLISKWEENQTKAEEGHVARLDMIADKNVLSGIAEKVGRGDVEELVSAAQSVLDDAFEDAKNTAISGTRNLQKTNEQVVNENPTCNWVLQMKKSLESGSLEMLKNSNLLSQVIKRLSEEAQRDDDNSQSHGIKGANEKTESPVWNNEKLDQVAIEIETIFNQQEQALKRGDLGLYDQLYQKNMGLMDGVQRSLPLPLHDYWARLLEKFSHETLARRQAMGRMEDELRKRI